MEKVDFHIGIMDDKQVWIDKMKNILASLNDFKMTEHINFIFCEFLSGAEFFDNEESKKCQLLLLDYKMPEMDGLEVAREIERRNLRTKIIFMSDLINVERVSMQANAIDSVIGFFKKNDPEDSVLYQIKGGIKKILDIHYIELDYYDWEYDEEKQKNVRAWKSTFIDGKKIEIIESSNKESILYMRDGSWFSTGKLLKNWIKDLQYFDFMQINKSLAVNLKYVLKTDSKTIDLINKKSLKLSRMHKKEFEEKYKAYQIRKLEK